MSKFDFTFFGADDNETDQPTDVSIEVPFGGYGVSLGLFYTIKLDDSFSTYLGGRIQHIYSQKFYRYNPDTIGTKKTNKMEKNSIYLVLGGQYMISRNFGIFGDVGIGFINKIETKEIIDNTTKVVTTDIRYNQTTTIDIFQGYFGVVFYL